jgi:TfoX/Sxy family transcriptional regulator of competence genes
MAFDEYLAERIRIYLKQQHVSFTKKMMIGGIAFMVNDKMCVGVVKKSLMARIDPVIYEILLKKKGCRVMDFTGRPMKGYVFVDSPGTEMDADLAYWVDLALEYNPKAKSSKKSRKS